MTALVLFATVSWLSHGAWAAQGNTVQRLCTVTGDAEKGLVCTLDVIVDPMGEAKALKVDCSDPDPSHKTFTLEQLRAGVPLIHKAERNLDVVTLSVENFDPIHGGRVRMHYLTNYFGKVYQDWVVDAHGDAGVWMLYTNSEEGRMPFNTVFAVKRSRVGITVGIKEFRPSWVGAFTASIRR